MPELQIPSLIDSHRRFFGTGQTFDLTFRKRQLARLEEGIQKHEAKIFSALSKDLQKPPFESYTSEIGFVYEEIRHTTRQLRRWARTRRVPTPLIHWPANSMIVQEPYGVVLIIGPWNYPFQLLFSPLVGAMAAGNCVVLKPSELAPHISKVVAEMVSEFFPQDYVSVVEGGVETSQALLLEHWGSLFFTGGTAVGRIVMEAAAKNLTPVTLELGGKSPCIVDEETDLKVAARRIVWGKFYNAGQTCIAPDYALVHKNIRIRFFDAIRESVRAQYGSDAQQSPDYARIINDRHFGRLVNFLNEGKIIVGGKTVRADRYIEPTVLTDISLHSRVMEEEIFGPILPVLEFENLDEAIQVVRQRPQPLSLYLFTNNKSHQKKITEEIAFGGGCINDTLIHFATPHLPFGGVGPSGMGAYHGKFSFDTFSRSKAIVERSLWPDIKLRYPPYRNHLKWIRRLMG